MTQLKMHKRFEQMLHKGRGIDSKEANEKRLKIISHWGYANKKHTIALHTIVMVKKQTNNRKKNSIPNVSGDADQMQTLIHC